MFEVETSPTSHRQLDTRDALACMGKAEGGETESRVSDTEEARADRPGAQKAARRISPSPTGFDRCFIPCQIGFKSLGAAPRMSQGLTRSELTGMIEA